MEKRGLTTALVQQGVSQGEDVVWGDEMRLGLHGQVRRRWTGRGVKLRQVVQLRYVWRYLALTVSPSGQLRWTWISNMKKESVAQAVIAWQQAGVQAVVWDNASSHRANLVRAQPMKFIGLPAYAPELNPAERVFEEIRRAVEGRVYADLEAKVQAVEAILTDLAGHPDRVRRLAAWSWIAEALTQLPPPLHTAFS